MIIEYGYIEDGYLRTKVIETQIERYIKDGECKERVITVDEQINSLDPKWKPVDHINESLHKTDREYYTIRIIPYDAGDRISFKYVEVPDFGGINAKIEKLKNELKNGDYKVIKCYEAYIVGDKAPYNINSIHKERENLRNKINQLENIIHQLKITNDLYS